MKLKLFVTMVVCGLSSACASSSKDIAATYVSPIQYSSYSCRQIGEEASRLSSRAAVAAGVQDEKRTGDAIATTAAIVVFWPAAFFIGGDNAQTAELARLKGEMEALEQASIQKNCGIQFRRA